MRKDGRLHPPLERTRRATLGTIKPLVERGNIFEKANSRTLDLVIQNSVVRRFDRGEVVFGQGERTDNLPFFCILSGRFDVIHVWGNNQRHIVTDGAGDLIGDVELLLRGKPLNADESALRGLSADQTWARVQCSSGGELLSIWPADFLLEEDHAVAVALAGNLAGKLLLRSAIADPKTILPKPKQVEQYLRDVAKDIAGSHLDSVEFIEIPMSLADVAGEVGCAKQTVAVALKGLAQRHRGFSHRRSLIVVPTQFVKEPLRLFDRGTAG